MSSIAILTGGILLGTTISIICLIVGYAVGKETGYNKALADEYKALDDGQEEAKDDMS